MSVTAVTKHKLTIAEYRKLGESLPPNVRVELIEGELYDRVPIGSEHADIVEFVGDLFRYALAREFGVRRQNPVNLGPNSEPEPDICVVKPRSVPYSKAHPGPADILLIIEVSDRSLPYDRDIKLPLYAKHKIPEVWIVDLINHQLKAYFAPEKDAYQKVLTLKKTGTIAPKFAQRVLVDVEKIFSRL